MSIPLSTDHSEKSHTDENLLDLRNISKKFGYFVALNDINFTLKKGEILGYIGPNGAGKTTTMKIIVGLIRQFEGTINLYGHPLSKTQNEIYQFLGYLPQDVGFQTWRTVNHLLDTLGRLSSYDPQKLPNRIDEVLQIVGLNDVKNKKIVHLSGGMKQKLRLAQALLHKPTFLVLDEPMSGLDPSSRYQMKKIILQLAQQGITIFLSSHILSDVQDIADRIAIINHGRILNVGTPQELQSKFRVGHEIEIILSETNPDCDILHQLPQVSKVVQHGNLKFVLTLNSDSDLDTTLHEILEILVSNKCVIRNFNLLQPSLEDVYLQYVKEDV
ncbi:ATP-binding cassette domain-containing protein [Promethearchaeum syntrophicum]|uniref:ATP-binding cassette domain-containing protein n=1 Tax=Promethearchaeum syntrophicum TaxID=2594042 RepID=A0A5B9D9I5_9ARCH|nr:ABC transporter ATP-binding protein [Candidatus Prometheoarchaeum syntrophicum]QEE15256.1 Trehalose/maltose import ATP-binding protein MalK [Candidatus Prometheoarchaeum syntrophicum]